MKSHCKKKYCDCFAQGLKCTNKCICMDCHNFLELKEKEDKMEQEEEDDGEKMEEEQGEGEEMQF
mgnify:FL=1|jgi:hypothetical protein